MHYHKVHRDEYSAKIQKMYEKCPEITSTRNKQMKSKPNEDNSVEEDDPDQPRISMSLNDKDESPLSPDDAQKEAKKLTRKSPPKNNSPTDDDGVPKKKGLKKKLKKIPTSVKCPYPTCMGLILKSDNALDAHIKMEHKSEWILLLSSVLYLIHTKLYLYIYRLYLYIYFVL